MASPSAERFSATDSARPRGRRATLRLPRMPSPMAGPDAGCVDTVAALTRRELTAEALVEAALIRIADRMATSGPGYGRRRRRAGPGPGAGSAMASGRAVGPLHGVPVGIKDIIDVAGLPTRSGAAPVRPPAPDGREARRAAARGGRGDRRQDGRDQFAYKDPAADAEPVVRRPHAGRLVVGIGRGGRGPTGAWSIGTQTVGLDPAAVGVLRGRRAQGRAR